MLRILLTIIVPLALPTILYLLYTRVERRRLQAAGAGEVPPWWAEVPWVRLLAVGIGCMAVVLVSIAMTSGTPVGGRYEPARYEDGQLIPGRTTTSGWPD